MDRGCWAALCRSTAPLYWDAPPGLADWEAYVMASDAPAVCIMDRDLVRALLRYVRRLERDVAVAEGSFW
jgi:hypothetical protein